MRLLRIGLAILIFSAQVVWGKKPDCDTAILSIGVSDPSAPFSPEEAHRKPARGKIARDFFDYYRLRTSATLTPEQEAEMASLRETLFRNNQGLVHFMITEFEFRRSPIRYQAGHLALLEAIDHFDPTKGVQFSVYAKAWILPNLKTLQLYRRAVEDPTLPPKGRGISKRHIPQSIVSLEEPILGTTMTVSDATAGRAPSENVHDLADLGNDLREFAGTLSTEREKILYGDMIENPDSPESRKSRNYYREVLHIPVSYEMVRQNLWNIRRKLLQFLQQREWPEETIVSIVGQDQINKAKRYGRGSQRSAISHEAIQARWAIIPVEIQTQFLETLPSVQKITFQKWILSTDIEKSVDAVGIESGMPTSQFYQAESAVKEKFRRFFELWIEETQPPTDQNFPTWKSDDGRHHRRRKTVNPPRKIISIVTQLDSKQLQKLESLFTAEKNKIFKRLYIEQAPISELEKLAPQLGVTVRKAYELNRQIKHQVVLYARSIGIRPQI